MSDLRTAALAAMESRQKAEEAKRSEQKVAAALAAVARVKRSPLGEWLPDVVWEFVADLTDGATLVRENDGAPVLLGVRITKDGSRDQGPDEWEVGIYRPSFVSGFFGSPKTYEKHQVVKELADIGEYIDRTEPKLAPPEPCPGDPTHSITAHDPGGAWYGRSHS